VERARILIVEDEELVALSIQSYLAEMGHLGSRIATTGESAIGAIAEFGPDLVLMDINLGGAMRGTEAARFITEHFKLPVVFLTAYSDDGTLEDAGLARPYGYIVKPFDEKSLKSTIEMALVKAAGDGEIERSKEKLEAIIQSMGEGIVVTGSSGLVEYMNARAVALLGQSPKPKTASLVSILSLAEREGGAAISLDFVEVIFEGKNRKFRDCMVKGPGGAPFLAEVDLVPFRDARGRSRGLVLALREIKQAG